MKPTTTITLLHLVLIFLLPAVVFIISFFTTTPRVITFSDTARVADAARSVNSGQGSFIHHHYFSIDILKNPEIFRGYSFSDYQVPVAIYSLVFRLFSANDITITIFGFFAFAACALTVYLITRCIHKPASLIAAILFILNLYFLDYAVNFTSDLLFTLEILLFIYLLIIHRRYLAVLPLMLMFYTRPQAIIILVSYALTLLYIAVSKRYSGVKLSLGIFLFSALGGILLFSLITLSLSNRLPFKYPPIGTALITTTVNPGDYLRGARLARAILSPFFITSKTFYNFYNFLKNPERLVSPVIFVGFILFLYQIKSRSQEILLFKTLSLIIIFLLTLSASMSLPNARYVHPVIPLLIIAFSILLTDLLTGLDSMKKNVAIGLVLIVITLPVTGQLTLDYRFRRGQYNYGSPPAYKRISAEMAKYINPGELTVTNLDAWGSWYNNLSTMWFPLSMDMLNLHENKQSYLKYIVITNYKEQDGDFSLGEWKEVLENPRNLKSEYLSQNFKLVEEFNISSSEIYEKQEVKGVIFKRN